MFKQAARNINLPEKKETSERSNDYFRLLYEIFSLLPYETSIHVSCLYALISKKKRDRRKEWIGRGGEVIQLTGKPFSGACFIIFMKVPIRRIGYRLSLRHDVPYRRVAHAPI